MLVKIDWLSFTVRIDAIGEGSTDQRGIRETAHLAALAIEDLGITCERLGMTKNFIPSKGRKPYSHAYSWLDNGVTLFFHPRLDHALVEISGKGCDALLRDYWALDVLRPIAPRLTRIDVACDMLTETRPVDFSSQRIDGRFRSHSETISESGETCYIGSKTSNRYAKVYRYNPPHERSAFLRAEFTLKAEDAKNTATSIINDGLMPVATALGSAFGWLHPDWQPSSATAAELRAYRADRKEGKTLYWLNDTIAPLLLRLHREGTLDVTDWFQANVINKMNAEELAKANLIPF